MGTEAENVEHQDDLNPEGAGVLETEEGKETKPGEGAAGADEEEEVEVVHAGDSPASEEGKKGGVPRRVAKLLQKQQQQASEIERLQSQIKLLSQEQPAKPVVDAMPTMESVGFDHQKYQQAVQAYMATQSRSLISDELGKIQTSRAHEEAKAQRNASLEKHYERAVALKVPDYDTAEESAINIIGLQTVQEIAANVEDSELVIYHLGKNPAKAEEIAALIKTNPAKATYALGKLAAGLSIKPKTKPNPKAPDDPLSGAGAPSSGGSWEAKLEAARDKAAKTGDISHVSAVKKAAREAGVNL